MASYAALLPHESYYGTPSAATDVAVAEAQKRATYLSQMDQFYTSLNETIRQFDLSQQLSMLQLRTQKELTEMGYATQERINAANLVFGREQLASTEKLTQAGLNLQEKLGMAQVNLGEESLAWQKEYQGETLNLQSRELAQNKELTLKGYDTQLGVAGMQAKTQMGVAQLGAQTQLGVAQLNADTQIGIAQLGADTSIKTTGMQVGGQKYTADVAARTTSQGQQMQYDLGMSGLNVQMRGQDIEQQLQLDAQKLQRYGIDVGADTQHYGIDVGAETNHYGIDVNSETQKFIANLSNQLGISELEVRKYLGEMQNQTTIQGQNIAKELGTGQLDLQRFLGTNELQIKLGEQEFEKGLIELAQGNTQQTQNFFSELFSTLRQPTQPAQSTQPARTTTTGGVRTSGGTALGTQNIPQKYMAVGVSGQQPYTDAQLGALADYYGYTNTGSIGGGGSVWGSGGMTSYDSSGYGTGLGYFSVSDLADMISGTGGATIETASRWV